MEVASEEAGEKVSYGDEKKSSDEFKVWGGDLRFKGKSLCKEDIRAIRIRSLQNQTEEFLKARNTFKRQKYRSKRKEVGSDSAT